MTRCFEVFVILGLLVFQVIPGLNPGIQNDNKANLFDLDCRVKPGNDKKETSPGMTKEKKSPAKTKKKGRQYRKEFLLTILSTMLLKKKKRATRKLWHNDDN